MSDAGSPPVSPYPQQPIAVPTVITSEERNLSMLAHVLMILTGFAAPLIIFFVKRDSKFVRYHSLMAVFWQILVMAVWMIAFMVFMVSIFTTIGTAAAQGQNAPPPTGFFIFFPLMWFGWMLIWILNLILGIVFGIKAYEGKWSGYPVIKRLAAKAAGIDKAVFHD